MTKIKDYDLITVDEHRIQTTIDVYFQWKTLDIMLSTLSTRGINFPSEISENIVCYTCGYFLNKGSSGDAIDPNGNRIIEIKGSSSTGPSSFSPSERFDELVFVKLNKQNDTLLIYLTGINFLLQVIEKVLRMKKVEELSFLRYLELLKLKNQRLFYLKM